MNIGIMTYHWAVNYGAVLQSYALQTYLQSLGHEVEFVNYIPFDPDVNFIRKFVGRNLEATKQKWKTSRREIIFKPFVKRLNIGGVKYLSHNDLLKSPPKHDAYICGSDQIWNYSLVTSNSEVGVSHPYFLDFGIDDVSRIAYAPSFGSLEIEDDVKADLIKCLQRFDAISVREKSGVDIINRIGFNNVEWLPDPTFLLNSENYLNLEISNTRTSGKFIYSYVLEEQVDKAKKVLSIISENNNLPVYNIFMGSLLSGSNYKNITPSPEQWLHYIHESDFVVTNSFHSTVFAIIFHRPFITIPLDGNGSGRNERIVSLLDYLGLSDRILWKYEEKNVLLIKDLNINWDDVDSKIKDWRKKANLFLRNALLK